MKKKISILDYAGSKAGMDYYSMSLATGISKNNVEVFIYSNFENSSENFATTVSVFKRYVNSKISKFFDAIYGNIKAAFLIKENNSEFVIMHLFVASYFSLFQFFILWVFNIKTVTIIHDVEGFDKEKFWIKNFILNNFSWKLVVHNNFSKNEVLKNNLVKNPNKIYQIKHGGFIEKFEIQLKVDRQEALKYFELSDKDKYILFFGQIGGNKGLEILIESMKFVSSKVKLIIAGKELKWNPFDRYQKIINKLKLNNRIIKFIRFIEDHEMHKLFSISSASILPYTRSYQSGVLIMAMSSKLPVIVSDIAPMKEIVTHKINGLVFKSTNSIDLAEKINFHFNNLETNYNSYSNTAFKNIQEDYSWSEIGKKYCEFIN